MLRAKYQFCVSHIDLTAFILYSVFHWLIFFLYSKYSGTPVVIQTKLFSSSPMATQMAGTLDLWLPVFGSLEWKSSHLEYGRAIFGSCTTWHLNQRRSIVICYIVLLSLRHWLDVHYMKVYSFMCIFLLQKLFKETFIIPFILKK